MSHRILVTGSRDWMDVDILEAELEKYRPEYNISDPVVLVHGACEGADLIAARLWEWWNLPTEAHEAKWSEFGYAAGPIRNQRMVDLGADLCLAFPTRGSRGTWDLVNRARAAGIPVTVIYPKEVRNV